LARIAPAPTFPLPALALFLQLQQQLQQQRTRMFLFCFLIVVVVLDQISFSSVQWLKLSFEQQEQVEGRHLHLLQVVPVCHHLT
jgi:hypothetical protein